MGTPSEVKLKNLFQEKKNIEAEIQELSPQVVLTKRIFLWEDSGTRNESLVETKKKVSEALNKTLDESQCPWFDLVLHTKGRGSTGPFVDNVFVFGRREIIARNLQKIAEKIATKKQLKKEGVWIGFNSLGKPKIENFI